MRTGLRQVPVTVVLGVLLLGLTVPIDLEDTIDVRRISAPDLTRREVEVLTALCRPALQQDAVVAPSTAKDIADELVVTEAAVKQHLLRLYQKFRIAQGVNRRARLANELISAGVVHPLPVNIERDLRQPAGTPVGTPVGGLGLTRS